MKTKEQKALDAIVDTVLKYRPTSRSEPSRQRKRRKTILEKKLAKDAPYLTQKEADLLKAFDRKAREK